MGKAGGVSFVKQREYRAACHAIIICMVNYKAHEAHSCKKLTPKHGLHNANTGEDSVDSLITREGGCQLLSKFKDYGPAAHVYLSCRPCTVTLPFEHFYWLTLRIFYYRFYISVNSLRCRLVIVIFI